MEWHEIEVDGRHTVKFTDLPYVPLASPPQSAEAVESFVGLFSDFFLFGIGYKLMFNILIR